MCESEWKWIAKIKETIFNKTYYFYDSNFFKVFKYFELLCLIFGMGTKKMSHFFSFELKYQVLF